MPDIKMTLAYTAEKTIKPLADQVRKRARQLAELQKRAADEAEGHVKAVDDVTRWKGLAGEYLADSSPGSFDRYKTGLKRALAKEETARESVKIFAADLIPTARRELDTARTKLEQAFAALVVTARADYENRLTELLVAVVGEHDNWLAAISELAKGFGTSFHGEAPKVYHPRLGEVSHRLSGARWMTLKTAPPIPAVAAATSPAVPADACPGPQGIAPTPEVGESVTRDTPCAALLAPEAIDAAAECPTRDAAPLSAEANRARVLLRGFPMATETPLDPAENPPALAENPPEATPVDPDAAADVPTDLDPLAVDSEVDAVLDAEAAAAEADAEAPPVAGEKENLKIVEEGT